MAYVDEVAYVLACAVAYVVDSMGYVRVHVRVHACQESRPWVAFVRDSDVGLDTLEGDQDRVQVPFSAVHSFDQIIYHDVSSPPLPPSCHVLALNHVAVWDVVH